MFLVAAVAAGPAQDLDTEIGQEIVTWGNSVSFAEGISGKEMLCQ